jgi:hypothetical protein
LRVGLKPPVNKESLVMGTVITERLRHLARTKPPRMLFRYRPFDAEDDLDAERPGYLASVIRDRVIFVPAVSTFNDPWDCCPGFRIPKFKSDRAFALAQFLLSRHQPGPSGWHKHYAEELRRDIQQLGEAAVLARCHDLLNNEMRTRCVLCLSARGDIPLQWSYYAGGHSGYVLAFDGSVMPFLGAKRAHYRSAYPMLNIGRAKDVKHVIEQALLSKAKFWRHEVEWRLLPVKGFPGLERLEPQPCPNSPGIHLRISQGVLKAVILGVRMAPQVKDKVRRMARSFDPAVAVVEAKQTRYRFEVHLPGLP